MKTLASDLINGLTPEENSRKKKFVKSTGTLEMTLKGYDQYLHGFSHGKYLSQLKHVPIPSLTNQEIQSFYDFMNTPDRASVYSHPAISFYLGKLFNASKEKEIIFTPQDSVFRLCSLGLHFGTGIARKLHICGDAGDAVGCEMKRGTIYVHGNARIEIGKDMQGGEIIIDGKVNSVASFTKGIIRCSHADLASSIVGELHAKTIGTIKDDGNTDTHSGKIYVEKDITHIGYNCRADVYIAGKRIPVPRRGER